MRRLCRIRTDRVSSYISPDHCAVGISLLVRGFLVARQSTPSSLSRRETPWPKKSLTDLTWHRVKFSGLGDFHQLDVEFEGLSRQRMITVNGDGVVFDGGNDEGYRLAVLALCLQLHAHSGLHVVG